MNKKRIIARAGVALLAAVVGVGTTLITATPAQAAVPDKHAFVLYNGGAVVPSGTSIPGTTVVPMAVGRYQVKFPGQATTRGIVHVTAIGTVARWCQAETWFPSGVDELVNIACFRFGGIPDWSAFSLFFTRSSGASAFGPYGYVDATGAGAGIVSQYNSAGAVNTVAQLGVGRYHVKFPGIGSAGPRDGSLQATAVKAGAGARCNVVNWASSAAQQDALVYCFTSAGALADSRFTLSWQLRTSLNGRISPPKYYGYLWWAPGGGPASTNLNSTVGFGGNAAGAAGPVGQVTVKFPNIGFTPDTVLVTAYGPIPNWCGLTTPWSHFGADTVAQNVICWTPNGAPVNNGFLISANSLL